jgi:hypothetical protein
MKQAAMVLIALGTLFTAALVAATDKPASVVQAADSPVRLDRATVMTPEEGPPVLLYSATNLTDADLDQFTVLVFVFDAQGILKARQLAPARHLLKAKETKYSAMVLDGFTIDPTHIVVAGVNQAQRVGSDSWWRGDLQPAAEAAAKKAASPN